MNEQQDSIGLLEGQVKSLQSAKLFLEEACERAKNHAVLIQGKLDGTLADLEEEGERSRKLEEQNEILRCKLERASEQAQSSKVTDISNDKELRQQLESIEFEKARL